MEPAPDLSQLTENVSAGHELGRYELLVPIASGGMAMVWAARLKGTRGFQKIVAVKTMLPKLSDDASFEQMFLDEASLASQIRHPHVVEILDLGEQDGVLYLVMEWINGVPLNQLMKTARRSGGVHLPVAVRIVMQACAGLHAAHELRDPNGQLVGLVHRDVSPQNILVSYDGVTKVVDFGVAKATARGGGATAAGQVKGKVAYMAPEQIKGDAVDRRIDVFAIGIVLYALTTGKHPFRKDSEAATLYNILEGGPVVPPRMIVPGYPAQLERVVQQALARDPAKRFPTANDLLRALDQALPSSMRASTDEDVAAFVRGLFSERRERHRVELARALKAADERAESKVSLRTFLDSQPPPSGMSVSDVTGPTATSAVSARATLESADSVPSMPSMNGQTLSSIGLELPQKKPRWGLRLLVATVVAGAAGLGVAALTHARQPAPSPPKIATATATQPAPTGAPSSELGAAATTPSAAASAEPVPSANAEPEPGASVAAPATEKAHAEHARRHYVRHAARKTPASGSNNSWREDPGF
jgi:eukaryotic-like serine/threonine-protein kinase